MNDLFSKWTVLKCNKCSKHNYAYGQLNDCNTECICGCKDTEAVIKKDWDAEDYVIICGNELEDANYHSIAELPENIYKSVKQMNLSPNLEFDIVINVVREIYKTI